MRMLRPLAVVLALAAVPFVITALSRVPVVAAAENGRDPAKATPESVGLVGGTWFSVDPIADLGFVGMIQQWNGRTTAEIQGLSRNLVDQALVS